MNKQPKPLYIYFEDGLEEVAGPGGFSLETERTTAELVKVSEEADPGICERITAAVRRDVFGKRPPRF